jgi:hypothetical protein
MDDISIAFAVGDTDDEANLWRLVSIVGVRTVDVRIDFEVLAERGESKASGRIIDLLLKGLVKKLCLSFL